MQVGDLISMLRAFQVGPGVIHAFPVSSAFPIPAKKEKPRNSGPRVTTSSPAELLFSLQMGSVSIWGRQPAMQGSRGQAVTLPGSLFTPELVTVSKDKAIHVLDVEQGRLERRISKAHR